jgi:uncharacterized protein (TIGR02145 family)
LFYVYDYQGIDVIQAKETNNFKIYGVLYNWEAAANACLPGWHLPTDGEWKTLEKFLGMSNIEVDEKGERGESGNIAGKLRDTGYRRWYFPNRKANNASRLTALPGGFRGERDGVFYLLHEQANFWTSTVAAVDSAWFRDIFYSTLGVGRNFVDMSQGSSVRCIKD